MYHLGFQEGVKSAEERMKKSLDEIHSAGSVSARAPQPRAPSDLGLTHDRALQICALGLRV